MSKHELRCTAEPADIEPARPDATIRDAFDDLLEGSSLGSPAARQIRNMTSADDTRRLRQGLHILFRSAQPQTVDVDDAVLALVQMCNLMDAGGQAPSCPSEPMRQKTADTAQSQPLNRRRWLSPYAPLEIILSQVLASCQQAVQDSDPSCPTGTAWTAMRLVQRLVAQPDGPARALQHLIDHGVVADVREDVARAIVSTILSSIGTSSPTVLRACAAALESSLPPQKLIQQFTDSLAASREVPPWREALAPFSQERSERDPGRGDRVAPTTHEWDLSCLLPNQVLANHDSPYVVEPSAYGAAQTVRDPMSLDRIAGPGPALRHSGTATIVSGDTHETDQLQEPLISPNVTGTTFVITFPAGSGKSMLLSLIGSLCDWSGDALLPDEHAERTVLQQWLSRTNQRSSFGSWSRWRQRHTGGTEDSIWLVRGGNALQGRPLLFLQGRPVEVTLTGIGDEDNPQAETESTYRRLRYHYREHLTNPAVVDTGKLDPLTSQDIRELAAHVRSRRWKPLGTDDRRRRSTAWLDVSGWYDLIGQYRLSSSIFSSQSSGSAGAAVPRNWLAMTHHQPALSSTRDPLKDGPSARIMEIQSSTRLVDFFNQMPARSLPLVPAGLPVGGESNSSHQANRWSSRIAVACVRLDDWSPNCGCSDDDPAPCDHFLPNQDRSNNDRNNFEIFFGEFVRRLVMPVNKQPVDTDDRNSAISTAGDTSLVVHDNTDDLKRSSR